MSEEQPGRVEYEEDEETRIRRASMILKLRSLGIGDRSVLNAIETVPRTLFVADEYRQHAYEERALPIECGQTISAPTIVGTMTSALDVGDRHSVLEVGTGSGYQAAILSRLARRVTTIERFRSLMRLAEERWQQLGIRNVTGIVADGTLGWTRQAPFDRILVTAATEAAPARLVAQLTDTGILIAPVGPAGGVQRLTLFQRRGQTVDTRDLGAVRFVPVIAGVAQNL